jgi:hypothetical protein
MFAETYPLQAQHNDALQVERYVGYSYGYSTPYWLSMSLGMC